jgi:hypothetical protein
VIVADAVPPALPSLTVFRRFATIGRGSTWKLVFAHANDSHDVGVVESLAECRPALHQV